MIIVEQKPKKILPFTDHAIVLDRGAIAHEAPSAELLADPAALDAASDRDEEGVTTLPASHEAACRPAGERPPG